MVEIFRFLKLVKKFLFLKRLQNDWLKFADSKMESTSLYESLTERKSYLIALLKESGIAKPIIPYIEPAGMGYVKQSEVDVFENFTFKNIKVADVFYNKLLELKGYYRIKAKATVNPLTWIEDAVFLPRNIAEILGIGSDGLALKIVQIVYWICGILVAMKNLYPKAFDFLR